MTRQPKRRKPRAVVLGGHRVRILGSHSDNVPKGHRCSEWCGQVKCMCGFDVHVEVLPDPPKARK